MSQKAPKAVELAYGQPMFRAYIMAILPRYMDMYVLWASVLYDQYWILYTGCNYMYAENYVTCYKPVMRAQLTLTNPHFTRPYIVGRELHWIGMSHPFSN